MIRALLDANIVISANIAPKGAPAAILKAWRAEYLEVISCPALVAEIERKLHEPRILKRTAFQNGDVAKFVAEYSQTSVMVPGTAPVPRLPPDPNDTMLFAAAIESQPDYIVTGDKALL